MEHNYFIKHKCYKGKAWSQKTHKKIYRNVYLDSYIIQ